MTILGGFMAIFHNEELVAVSPCSPHGTTLLPLTESPPFIGVR